MNLEVAVISTILILILFYLIIDLTSDLIFKAYFRNKLKYKKDLDK